MKKLTFALIFTILTVSTPAATFYLDANGTGDYPTIQAAIDDANDGDVIILAPGRYTGDGNRDVNNFKDITIQSADLSADCIIDCEANNADRHRAFYIDANVTLVGLTITNGFEGYGAAIRCVNAPSVELIDCHITENTALSSLIMAYKSNLILNSCRINDNAGDSFYELFYIDNSSVDLTNCTLKSNMIGRGRVMFAHYDSNATFVNCLIMNNYSTEEKQELFDFYNGNFSLTFRNSIIFSNSLLLFNKSIDPNISYSVIQGGWPGPGNTSTNPMLTLDGYLTANSPCINNATDINAPTHDVDGDARPFGAGYDIGPDEFIDTDSDGLPDWWELKYFGSATAADPNGDGDLDNIINLIEYKLATNPFQGPNTYYVDPVDGNDSYDGQAQAWNGLSGPKLTIQNAIDTAPGNNDTIILSPGIYNDAWNETGIDFLGKAITLRSADPNDPCVVAATIVDCQNKRRAFVFRNGEIQNTILSGITIKNGKGFEDNYKTDPNFQYIRYDIEFLNSYPKFASAILCHLSSPRIEKCHFLDNKNNLIFSYNSSPVISNCTFENSKSIVLFGGSAEVNNCHYKGYKRLPYFYGTLTCYGHHSVNDSNLLYFAISKGNTKFNNCYITYRGLEIINSGSAVFNNCIFTGIGYVERDYERYHYGIRCIAAADVNFVNCEISNNLGSAPPLIVIANGSYPYYSTIETNVTFDSCRFFNNSCHSFGIPSSGNALLGAIGGKYGTNVNLENCIFRNNSTGPLFFMNNAVLNASNCTIISNKNVQTNGNNILIWLDRGEENSIKNCVIWANKPDIFEDHDIRRFPKSTFTNNLIQGGFEGTDTIDIDPLLTPDGHLTAASPCIDAGNDFNVPALDIDGEPRPYALGVDIGADEFIDTDGDELPDWWELKYFGSTSIAKPNDNPDGDPYTNIEEYEIYSSDPNHAPNTWYVDANRPDDSGDGLSWPTAKKNIQPALNLAQHSDTVIIAEGQHSSFYYSKYPDIPISLYRGLSPNGKAITIRGTDPCDPNVTLNTIVKAPGSSVCLLLDNGESPACKIQGLTLIGNKGFDVKPYPYSREATVFCYGSSPTITDCFIDANEADYAVSSVYGNPLIKNCNVKGPMLFRNSANVESCSIENGGIICDTYETKGGSIDINNCYLDRAGIRTRTSKYGSIDLDINNCYINSFSGHWSGIDCSGGDVRLSNSTMRNCYPSAIRSGNSNLAINRCLITDNKYGGAAIEFRGSSNYFNLTNSIICGNQRKALIHTGNSETIIDNCTFENNCMENSSMLYFNNDSNTIITNSIIGKKADGSIAGVQNWSKTSLDISYCNIAGGQSALNIYDMNSLNWGPGNIDTDPCYVDPGYWDTNGTPADANDDYWVDGDYYLKPESLCINAGDPNSVLDPNYPTDYEGNPRVAQGRIDIGAFEFQPEDIQVKMFCIPRILTPNSRRRNMFMLFSMPPEISKADIDMTEKLTFHPGNVKARRQFAYDINYKSGKRTYILGVFDKNTCTGHLSPGNNAVECQGQLKSGQNFYGTGYLKLNTAGSQNPNRRKRRR